MPEKKADKKNIPEIITPEDLFGIDKGKKSPEKQSPQDEIGIIGIKPKEESEIPIREGGAGYFAPSFAFSDIEGKDKKGLVDAERHLQVDILSLPSIRRIIQYPEGTDIDPRKVLGSQGQQLLQRETTFDLLVQLRHAGVEIDPRQIRTLTSADVVTIANQILRDADLHGQVDVLSTANPPNLDVALSTRAKDRITATDFHSVRITDGTAFLDPREIRPLTSSDIITAVQTTPANLQATVTQAAKDRVITDITKVSIRKYLAPTSLAAGGTATVWTPATGKAIRLKFFSVTTNAATQIALREGTTDWIAYYLPANSVVSVNLIGTNTQFAANASLIVYSSAAATVSVTAMGDEV